MTNIEEEKRRKKRMANARAYEKRKVKNSNTPRSPKKKSKLSNEKISKSMASSSSQGGLLCAPSDSIPVPVNIDYCSQVSDISSVTASQDEIRSPGGLLLVDEDDCSIRTGDRVQPDEDGDFFGVNMLLRKMGEGDKFSPTIDHHPQVRSRL